MARVHLTGELRRLAGGAGVIEVDAATVGELVSRLGEMHPDLGTRLGEGTAVAVDGEIMAHPDFEPVGPDTVIHFLPPIGGG